MKRLHVRVALFIALLVGSWPMYGMWASIVRQVQGKAAVRRAAPGVGAVARPTVSRQNVATASAMGATGQSRAYQASVAKQSNQGWFSSLFGSNSASSTGQSSGTNWWSRVWHHELTPEEFVKEIEECFIGSASFGGSRYFFDDTRFEKVKKLIDENKERIDQPIDDGIWLGYGKSYDPFRGLHLKNGQLTLLDRVLWIILRGDLNNTYYMPSESVLKLIELVQYLISKGAVITPEYEADYKRVYDEILMDGYKGYCRYFSSNQEKIQMMSEIFLVLDPMLEKLMPGFKDTLQKAQKERADIAADPASYEEYEQNQKEFMRYKERQWRERHNNWNPDIYPYEMGIEFDDAEYRQWLKYGKARWDKSQESFKTGFEDRFQSANVQDVTFQNLLGVHESATYPVIMKAYRAFIQENHPDHLQSLVSSGRMAQAEVDERIEKMKQVNAAYAGYKESEKEARRQSARE